jgi:hypothetical protein
MGINTDDEYICVNTRLPVPGIYDVRLTRDGEILHSRKKLVQIADGKSHWFGGCRPFSENDIVTHWKEPKLD